METALTIAQIFGNDRIHALVEFLPRSFCIFMARKRYRDCISVLCTGKIDRQLLCKVSDFSNEFLNTSRRSLLIYGWKCRHGETTKTLVKARAQLALVLARKSKVVHCILKCQHHCTIWQDVWVEILTRVSNSMSRCLGPVWSCWLPITLPINYPLDMTPNVISNKPIILPIKWVM